MPGCERVVVPEAKIRGYLLATTHPVGRDKALFFLRFGFDGRLWRRLADALASHARGDVEEVEPTRYGVKYVIEGPLHAPDVRTPWIRSVWVVEADADPPRFVTAYPAERTRR